MRSGKWLLAVIMALSLLPVKAQNKKSMKYDTITLGTGCFWCSQAVFERVKGVVSATAGYSGGEAPDPTYQQVCTGTTGYAEVVQVVYDPQKLSLEKLLEIFWKTHNPTTLNRQGADVGTQYRSVIFYHNAAQKAVAEALKKRLEEEKIWADPVVTEISPFKNFYLAEKYHQDYYLKNPSAGYCQFVITPKLEKFEKIFHEEVKKR
ncbi:MAG TPA: peptide-methionine (S)-S-oxide reductase [Bacteroidetes bacterium]|nr:peptide-methionine (S)-S-oxide reductase [Bacteroidota bacterium]